MSDAFYQALSMKCDSLPRASKVKAARWEFNKTVELFSIPTFDGSYRHVETAIREEITRLVSVLNPLCIIIIIIIIIIIMQPRPPRLGSTKPMTLNVLN